MKNRLFDIAFVNLVHFNFKDGCLVMREEGRPAHDRESAQNPHMGLFSVLSLFCSISVLCSLFSVLCSVELAIHKSYGVYK